MTDELTVTQAARLIGVIPRRVRQLCEMGRIRARWTGTRWRIRTAIILAYRAEARWGRPRDGKRLTKPGRNKPDEARP
jgi:excisionase family DNA binding protein